MGVFLVWRYDCAIDLLSPVWIFTVVGRFGDVLLYLEMGLYVGLRIGS